jgi:hypothetical protein
LTLPTALIPAVDGEASAVANEAMTIKTIAPARNMRLAVERFVTFLPSNIQAAFQHP